MRTNIFIAAVLLALVSCGGEATLEERKAALDAKKVELAKLQNEVNKMEEALLAQDSTLGQNKELGILVEVKKVAPEDFEHYFEVNGSLEAVEQANISPEQGGQIKQILVKEGDKVAAGTVLATLNVSVFQTSMQEIDNGIELAQTVYDRQARLWEQKIGSEIQYLEAKNRLESLQKKRGTLSAQMAMSTVKAPFAGVVDRIYQKTGELAAPGQPMLTLVNMSEMKVKADVSENYVQAVKENAEVDVDFPSFGVSTKARIRQVSNIINPSNRTFSVEVRVPNANGALKPNGIATLKIKDFEMKEALVVPAIAIGKDAKGAFLFVINEVEGKSKAIKKYVTTGRTSGGQTRVVEGLLSGDRVVVEGYNEVANGDLVHIQG
ncbi:MAG: efflux RND transporter periplasmic adaptor subunit [Flavobacteriales bacterium]|nr:efflux RND transporter periplasmic adaptor subunit [Flavobacteriales bacterium]